MRPLAALIFIAGGLPLALTTASHPPDAEPSTLEILAPSMAVLGALLTLVLVVGRMVRKGIDDAVRRDNAFREEMRRWEKSAGDRDERTVRALEALGKVVQQQSTRLEYMERLQVSEFAYLRERHASTEHLCDLARNRQELVDAVASAVGDRLRQELERPGRPGPSGG